MKPEKNKYRLTNGKISNFIKVDESIIRFIHDQNEEYAGFYCQGKITNISESKLSNITIDISYYDSSGSFLGLNDKTLVSKEGIMNDLKYLNINDSVPFDINLDIPENTSRCILNIMAQRRSNIFLRFLCE